MSASNAGTSNGADCCRLLICREFGQAIPARVSLHLMCWLRFQKFCSIADDQAKSFVIGFSDDSLKSSAALLFCTRLELYLTEGQAQLVFVFHIPALVRNRERRFQISLDAHARVVGCSAHIFFHTC